MEQLIANLHHWEVDWRHPPDISITEFSYKGDAQLCRYENSRASVGSILLQLTVQDNFYYRDERGLPKHVQRWLLHCDDVIECTLSMNDPVYSIELADNHPRLWMFFEPHVELFFRGKPHDTAQLLAEWSTVHENMCGCGFPLTEMMGPVHHLVAKLNGGFGSLGDVPTPVAESYIQCLERHGVHCSSLAMRMPPENQRESNYQIILMNDQWVIGRNVRVKYIDGPKPDPMAIEFDPMRWNVDD